MTSSTNSRTKIQPTAFAAMLAMRRARPSTSVIAQSSVVPYSSVETENLKVLIQVGVPRTAVVRGSMISPRMLEIDQDQAEDTQRGQAGIDFPGALDDVQVRLFVLWDWTGHAGLLVMARVCYGSRLVSEDDLNTV